MLKERSTLLKEQGIFSNRRWMFEVVIRSCIILTMLLNALAPTLNASASSTKPDDSKPDKGINSLPVQTHSIYQPN